MNTKIRYPVAILIASFLARILGQCVKLFSFPFHFLFPRKRFTIPEFSRAKRRGAETVINKTIWQTNYSNKVTLPVYCNYLFNRALSWSFDYRYVSTEARDEYIQTHADERTYRAYSQLTDGAAQADFWRLFVLYREGGVYMDIDAHIIWCLASIIAPDDREVLITRRGKYTNFFLASCKGNEFLRQTLDIIIDNIEQRRVERGVFHLTGPTTLNLALEGKTVNTRLDKLTCVQGTFTNEYFQYMDKKRGKWNHKKNDELLK